MDVAAIARVNDRPSTDEGTDSSDSDLVTFHVISRVNDRNRVTSQMFAVHVPLIKEHSGYFRTLLEDPSHPRVFELPNTEPRVFSDFVDWLYNINFDNGEWIDENELQNLIKIYILCERLTAEKVKGKVFNKFANSLLKGPRTRHGFCEMLRQVSTELTDRPDEVMGLRSFMFTYTFLRRDSLKDYLGFLQLLNDVPDLARWILCSKNPSETYTKPSPIVSMCYQMNSQAPNNDGFYSTPTVQQYMGGHNPRTPYHSSRANTQGLYPRLVHSTQSMVPQNSSQNFAPVPTNMNPPMTPTPSRRSAYQPVFQRTPNDAAHGDSGSIVLEGYLPRGHLPTLASQKYPSLRTTQLETSSWR